MSLCALAFISCQKEEMTGNDPVEGNYTYEFVAYQQPEAKATIGDKTDGKWPVLWSKGDQMGVYKADGTFVGIAAVSDESEGQNSGNFKVTSDVELVAGDNLYFSYPYVKDAEIKTGKVAAEQTLGTSGVGANAIAYATVAYNPGNTQFVLTHANAYLKFNIKSEEFAGYNLTGVTLWADGAELAGNAQIADGGALTVSAAEDYVKSTLATPMTVTSDAQAVCVAALPGDLSGKTVYAIVHMKGIEGTETATHTVELPIRLNGAGSLNAGSVTEIDLPFLTTALAPKWYEPVETRYVAAYGKGWSYGKENTVLFRQYKTAQTVDLKARGNFMKVTEPKYVQVYYFANTAKPTDTTAPSRIEINGTLVASINDTKFPTEVAVSSDDCSVSILLNNLNYAKGQMAAILVKDKDHNTIWGLNLWLAYQAMTTVKYENGEILNRNLGTDETFIASTNGRLGGCYFQWGRPFAFPNSSNNYGKGYLVVGDNKNVTSLEVSASNPYTLYCTQITTEQKYNMDWFYGSGTFTSENDLRDLWGNPDSSTSSGMKSIYDPCPKGYRVVSPAVLKEVMDNAEIVTTGTYKYLKYKDIDWGFAGGHNCDGWGPTTGNYKTLGTDARYWSNANFNNGEFEYASALYATYANNKVTYSTNYRRAGGFSVRCMVDTENR